MKLISWNVNGIRAILKKGFLDFVSFEDPDIICLQETKVQKDQVQINLPQYNVFWNYAKKKGYSGTAIFTKENPLSVSYGIGKDEHDSEGRVITLEYDSFFLINVYVPNSQRGLKRLSYREKWDEDFLSFIKNLEKIKPVILCGDLNVAHTKIDLANPKSNYNKTAGFTKIEIDGFKKYLTSNFVDTFRLFNQEPGNYTYWSYMFNARVRNIGWRIDYFLTSKKITEKIKKSDILKDVLGSDHCPISLIL